MTNDLFPAHKCSLTLQHNDHRSVYETVEQWCESRCEHFDWVSDDQRLKAIETDEVWTLQWYPNTPIGSHALAAAELDVLLGAAKGMGREPKKRS
jgi:hypothetical protein